MQIVCKTEKYVIYLQYQLNKNIKNHEKIDKSRRRNNANDME